MSKCDLVVNCSNCDEEVEFSFESKKLSGMYYLDEGLEGFSTDDMSTLDGRKKGCPRCDHPVSLKLNMTLETR